MGKIGVIYEGRGGKVRNGGYTRRKGWTGYELGVIHTGRGGQGRNRGNTRRTGWTGWK